MAGVSFTSIPRGPFSLRESAEFGFGQRDAQTAFDGIMRLAFCLDGYRTQVGVELRQDDDGVHGVVSGIESGSDDAASVQAQVERVLSLDQDATGFVAVGQRDPVIARLQRAAPGLRPPLFYSPYEAAAWSVLSARRPARQMADVRTALSEQHGATFQLAGERLAAFPTPEQLLDVASFPGLTPEKMERLHGVARAALLGRLDVARFVALGPDAAQRDVQAIKGIGPFYSQLVVVRAVGFTDVLTTEPTAMEVAGRLYNVGATPSAEQFAALAQPWRPFRTWATVLIRAAGPRLLDGEPAQSAT